LTKPLARWTIGPTSNIGMEILKESVTIFEQIYPEFDTVVCYNNIEAPNLSSKLFKQEESQIDYPLSEAETSFENLENRAGMIGSGWKLCPPRLEINSHELWIDNDIIISGRIKEIDKWLDGDYCLVSEGRHRLYGIFEKDIKPDLKICAGLFGLPPSFDFAAKIYTNCKKELKGIPLGHYDEQGLVASIITNSQHEIVPFSSLSIVERKEKLPVGVPAFHFVGANRTESHSGWSQYAEKKIKLF
jgi:hypothetical protein